MFEEYYKTIGTIFGVGWMFMLCQLWQVTIAVGVCCVLAIVILACIEVAGEMRTARLLERIAIAARADKQHAAFHRGDPYGIYGEFMPPRGLR